ncbi:NAD-dependent epimerase/dehydratase family protein [Patescibacteria group bacterium AH-259-L07]|nr:NAD-dependent epimerase/dehydratase family protein [Patescibacteria group bacterium AH-259-L07]
MRILVTGGAGFIGSHLVDVLIKNKHKVCIIDNLSTGLKENVNQKATFYNLDIRDKKILEIFKKEKPEVIFHVAAQINLKKSIEDPFLDADINILGSLNLLECCKKYGVKKFIFSSSGGAIYGEAKIIPTPEEHPTHPTSPYGLTKLAIEKYLDIYHQQHGLNFIALRYANVYGPRQNINPEVGGVIAIFVQNLLENKPCIINGDGTQTCDYVYIDDVVNANLSALKSNAVGVYNVGTGIETSVNQIFKSIIMFLKLSPKKMYGPPIKGEVQKSALDWKKIRKELRWRPKIDLDKGLKLTVDWFKNNN